MDALLNKVLKCFAQTEVIVCITCGGGERRPEQACKKTRTNHPLPHAFDA